MLEFNEEIHQYTLNGKIIPSVTQIIDEILGHAWSADEWYLRRGRAVHACAAFIALNQVFRYDPQIEGQVKALRLFFSQMKPQVITVESKMLSHIFRFAGTPDLFCRINGKPAIVDFKASLDKERTKLQLGGYSVLIGETLGGKPPDKGYGVEILPTGKYRMSETFDLRQARKEFLALRTAYGIRERLNILTRKEEK
jgi:hypothetical protein